MKSILFFSSILALMLGYSSEIKAYDVISEEDEGLLVGVVKGAKKSVEELKLEQKKRDADLSLRDNLDRSFEYPIGDERKDDNEWFKPFDFGEPKEVVDEAFEKVKNEYKARANDCFEKNLSDYGLERAISTAGNVYDNTAMMSVNFEEANSCLSDLGNEILDEFYGSDIEKVKEYEEKIANFYISGTGVVMDPSFCGERCSLKALFDMQLSKTTEFKELLNDLVDNAPRVSN